MIIISLFKHHGTHCSCVHKYTNGPMNGYYCNIGHYANISTNNQLQCTDMCIRDPSCYNVVHESCLLGSKPCAVAVQHSDFLLMVFRWDETIQCPHWFPPPNDGVNLPSRLVENKPPYTVHVAVGRIIQGTDIYPTHVAHVSSQAVGWAVLGVGNVVSEDINYDLLSVSPNCTLAWLPYSPGDRVPLRALPIGMLSDTGPTYSIRFRREDINADAYGVYIPGQSVGYSPHFGGTSVTGIDILVKV